MLQWLFFVWTKTLNSHRIIQLQHARNISFYQFISYSIASSLLQLYPLVSEPSQINRCLSRLHFKHPVVKSPFMEVSKEFILIHCSPVHVRLLEQIDFLHVAALTLKMHKVQLYIPISFLKNPNVLSFGVTT